VWESDGVELDELTPEQRAFVARTEPLWERAYRIVAKHPELDVSDVFHALRNLERTPSERLRRALTHGRPRVHAR
jgi:hypothetical protein